MINGVAVQSIISDISVGMNSFINTCIQIRYFRLNISVRGWNVKKECLQGAMGNYSTAFSVSGKKNEENVITLAKRVASQVINIRQHPQKEMLVLACYIHMLPELIDAVAISALGDFGSKAGTFVGRNMFGYGLQNGYSITNLGKIQSNIIAEAIFIPPASPANKKTWGVLTVNNHMKICTAGQH